MPSTPALAGVPVVVMSSMSEASIADRCSGYLAFVRKPFKITWLVEVVGEFSRRSRGESPQAVIRRRSRPHSTAPRCRETASGGGFNPAKQT